MWKHSKLFLLSSYLLQSSIVIGDLAYSTQTISAQTASVSQQPQPEISGYVVATMTNIIDASLNNNQFGGIGQLEYEEFVDICLSQTCISINLSLNPTTQNLFAAATYQTFSTTIASECSSCGAVEFQIISSPVTTNLFGIAADNSNQANNINFNQAMNPTDAQAYDLTIKAKFVGKTDFQASATATFTYVNPCLGATITWPAPSYLTTSVLKKSSVSVAQPQAMASDGTPVSFCGTFTHQKSVTSPAGTAVDSTISSYFYVNLDTALNAGESTYTFFVNPQFNQVGDYSVVHKVCFTDYSSICSPPQTSTVNITPCVITGLDSIQGKLSNQNFEDLKDITYQLKSPTEFSYQLKTVFKPNCDYSAIQWKIIDGPVLAGSKKDFFTDSGNIDAASGKYYISPSDGSNTNRVGQYTVQIAEFKAQDKTFNEAYFSQNGIKSSFVVNVVADPSCATTTITASQAPSTITVNLWDAEALYPVAGAAFDEFTDGVSASDPYMCPKTYTATIQPTTGLTTFQIDQTNRQFKIFADQTSQAQTYTVTLTGALQAAPTIKQSTSFQLIVNNPCSNTLLQPHTLSLQKMISSVKNPVEVFQNLPQIKDQLSIDKATNNLCGSLKYTISSTQDVPNNGQLSTDELKIDQNGKITVQTANSQTIGMHTSTVIVELAQYANVKISSSFQIEILKCALTSIQVVQYDDGSQLKPQTYQLSTTSPLEYKLKINQTPDCQLSVSNWQIEVVNESYSNLHKIDQGIYTYGATFDTTQVGTHKIQVKSVDIDQQTINLALSSLVQGPSFFELTVKNPCEFTTVAAATEVLKISFSVWDIQQFYPLSGEAFAEFTDSVSTNNNAPNLCQKSYEATVPSDTSGKKLTSFFFDPLKRQFQLQSNFLSEIGTYFGTLTGFITKYPSQKAYKQFQIEVLDPCYSTIWFQPDQLTGVQTSVLLQDSTGQKLIKTWQMGKLKDKISLDHGNNSGDDLCGQRIYSIQDVQIDTAKQPLLKDSEIKIDPQNGLISIYTADPQKIGIHKVTVQILVYKYSNSKKLISFIVEILPCLVTDYKFNQPQKSLDFQYQISSTLNAQTITISTTQVPQCGYKLEFSFAQTPDFVKTTTQQSIMYSVETRDKQKVGNYQFYLVSKLLDYNFTPPKNAPEIQYKLNLELIDPCPKTQITAQTDEVENLITFPGFQVKSKNFYAFNDSQSISAAQITDAQDFCGEKVIQFTLNNTQTQLLQVKSQEQINFSPTAQTTNYGTAQAQLIVSMKEYQQVQNKTINFEVTILGIQTPKIADVTYVIGQEKLVIRFESFNLLPQEYNLGSQTLKAYFQTTKSTQDTKFIDLKCNCLLELTNSSFLTFNQTENKITVYSSEIGDVGQYTIVIVKFYDNLPNQNPFTSFKLNIMKPQISIPIRSLPKFEQPIPAVVQLQCGTNNQQFWRFQLPPTTDQSQSQVIVSVFYDQKTFLFDQKQQVLSQIASENTSVNKTIKFVLTNELKTQNSYSMQVQFICEETKKNQTSTFVPQQAKITLPKTPVLNPAEILSISRTGILEIKFFRPLFIPNFKNSSFNTTTRTLVSQDVNQTLDQYINKDTLSIQLKSQYNLTELDWYCLDFQQSLLKIQILFDNPSEISQTHKDELLINFKQTDKFVLRSQSEYLFSNQSTKTIRYYVPAQIASKQTAQLFQSISQSVQSVGLTVIIMTLLIQIVAKKVITYMWLYYAALQLQLLIVQHSNMFPPSSVDIVATSISGIINLSSLDKKMIAEKLHIDALLNSDVFKALDGVALVSIGILLLVIFSSVAIVLTKKVPCLQAIFLKMKNMIFWNFLIRYFQASFIGFNFIALSNIQKKISSFTDKMTSSIILGFQYSTVVLFGYLLLKNNLSRLNSADTRQKFGTLYQNLTTNNRQQVMFGLMFFVQRILIVILLAFRYSFSIQWQLCQVVILLNTMYLFIVRPYQQKNNSVLDSLNCVLLLVSCIIMAAYSAWNNGIYERFIYGLAFDGLMGLQFLLNAAFILRQTATETIPKLKRAWYRYKLRRAKKAQKIQQAKQYFKDISDDIRNSSVSEKSDVKVKPKMVDTENTTQQNEEFDSQKKLRFRGKQDTEIKQERYLKFLDKISEESEVSVESDVEKQPQTRHQTNSISKKSEPPSSRQVQKIAVATSQTKILALKKVQRNQTTQQKRPTKDQLDKKEIIIEQQDKLSSQSNPSQLIQAKTKPSSIFSSKSPKVAQQITTIDQNRTFKQTCFEKEIRLYHSGINDGVRTYPPDWAFEEERDIWPYYKQVLDPEYQGRPIQLDEHNVMIANYLKKQWIESYPQMPYLPLFVSKNQYLEFCKEIEPEVKALVGFYRN